MTTTKPRARDTGLPFLGQTGPNNAITDVPGVLVGYETLCSHADPTLRTSDMHVQTGVTAILPRGFAKEPRPVLAGQFTLNGNGEMTGSHWIRDGGYFVGPVMLTNTHSVGAVHEGATRWIVEHYAEAWENNHLWAMPVVAETYDGVLNDINGFHVRPEHALKAIAAADTGSVSEGNIGGGAGMICYEYKGGTGTSSRRIEIDGENYTMGALVQANHGLRPWLTVLGTPVGATMTEDRLPDFEAERGSIICVLATNIPLSSSQLERLSRRASIGISRSGSPGGNNSGDIFMSFSTANELELPQLSGPWRSVKQLNDELLDPVYLAAVQAIEEAVLNAMFAAEDTPTTRPSGKICKAIDHAQLLGAMQSEGVYDPKAKSVVIED
ncbi:P1 family peptidase [Roseovarius sp. THAF8]|uniref:DmpA family aminopeptidase n=1 Tax=Roseovarius sp. THAF8 TaxID=2587846 RepID=UPI0020C76EF7|nr:P1 family peptidase [Roseovarius sp. THAF8]